MALAIKKIALDTNILLEKNALENVRDWFGKKTELVVPQQVTEELRTLAGKSKTWQKKITIIKEQQKIFGVTEKKIGAKNADDALVKLAEAGFAVLSLDKKLQKKIAEKKGIVIQLAGKKREA